MSSRQIVLPDTWGAKDVQTSHPTFTSGRSPGPSYLGVQHI
jgi:hypothetical protein